MKQDHITDILDNEAFANLSQSELQTIRVHVSTCAECEQAFEAAQLSALIMKERTSEAAQNALDANPFFQTRVLAAWRDEQSSSVWSLRRLWNATGALVASMAATTAVLAVLAFAAPSADTTLQYLLSGEIRLNARLWLAMIGKSVPLECTLIRLSRSA